MESLIPQECPQTASRGCRRSVRGRKGNVQKSRRMTPPGLLGEIATKLVGVRETGSGARGRRGE